MKKPLHKNYLKNINILITILTVILSIAAWGFSEGNRSPYILINSFFCILLLLFYLFLFEKQSEKNLNDIKKEILFINYPVNIGTFFICILVIILLCIATLAIVNQEALNLISVFTFFMSIISMLFPAMILLVFIYFIMPAFIIPGIIHKNTKRNLKKFYLILVLIFLILCLIKTLPNIIRSQNIEKQDKYKCGQISLEYSREPLNYRNISAVSEEKLKNIKMKVPFYYTLDSFKFDQYKDASNFCKNINAKVPDYLQMYHIAFNKFDTFGKKYYWTSNTDGKIPIILEFDNMSYKLIKYDGKITPLLYCVSDETEKNKKFFYKSKKIERENFIKNIIKNNSNTDNLEKILGEQTKQQTEQQNSYVEYPPQYSSNPYMNNTYQNNIDNERKHVSFNVKLVSNEVFEQLLEKGYNYGRENTINSRYEINDNALKARMNIDYSSDNIRLCYYPFINYGDMNIYNEAEIWKQSFCTPSFILAEKTPVLKTKYEKDSYCWAKGGRHPNIPELIGILKYFNKTDIGTKYWTNNVITDSITNTKIPVMAYYSDSQTISLQGIDESLSNEKAYTYCIKEPEIKSTVIANYKSRFYNENGLYYAKEICPSCGYYEVPDTIIMK